MKVNTLFLLLLVTQVSYADCTKKIFSCTFNNQKRVEVCDTKGKINYRFGKNLANPELSFSLPYHKTRTTQWQGIGRYEYDAVMLRNQQVIYTVFHERDKLEENLGKQVTNGITVTIKEKEVAKLICLPKTVYNKLHELDYLPESE